MRKPSSGIWLTHKLLFLMMNFIPDDGLRISRNVE